jgi:hypothetical protein
LPLVFSIRVTRLRRFQAAVKKHKTKAIVTGLKVQVRGTYRPFFYRLCTKCCHGAADLSSHAAVRCPELRNREAVKHE